MNPKLLIGSGWILSLGVAFWFGSLQQGPRLSDDGTVFSSIPDMSQADDFRQEIAQKDKETKELLTEIERLKKRSGIIRNGSVGSAGRIAQSFQGNSESPSVGSLQERLQAATGPMERMTILMGAFQGMNPSNVEEVVAAFKENTEPNRRFSEMRLLVHAWADFDPQGAVEWADKLGGWEERSAVGAALERWAVNDLDASLAWAREKFKGDDNPYLVGIIGGLTKSNPARASELLLEMPYGRNRGRAASVLLDAYWDKGEGEAKGWAEGMEDGSIKDYVTSQVAEKIARKDIGSSAQWVESLDVGRAKNRAVGMVAYQWARKDPSAASQWIDGMGEAESRFSGMEGLVKVWVDRDPAATAQWLNGYSPSEGKDGAVEIFVNAIKRKDPATAMEWAETMTDQKEREEAVSEVERIWRRGDPETYQSWKQSQPSGQQ